ncbi:hypothetical protein GOP47_0009140 [Adiantum capillus-veneris]|uniref:Uncharacterized protein n=1 Tax=Adiantum capillus-veneris TaxID=13818 RepID=A0A9D4V0A7_ADICA|nr:hypothetical protein GOP47_0009140 [Adiantum capillus-veneris]
MYKRACPKVGDYEGATPKIGQYRGSKCCVRQVQLLVPPKSVDSASVLSTRVLSKRQHSSPQQLLPYLILHAFCSFHNNLQLYSPPVWMSTIDAGSSPTPPQVTHVH